MPVLAGEIKLLRCSSMKKGLRTPDLIHTIEEKEEEEIASFYPLNMLPLIQFFFIYESSKRSTCNKEVC
jgi:hypothetical protein